MENNVKDMMNEKVLKNVTDKFGVDYDSLKLIGNFQSFIYEYKKNSENYILRITHSSHRSDNKVLGELDFVNYLYDNGLNVSEAIKSKNNKLVEIIDLENSYFIVTSFKKAKGEKIHYPKCMNNDNLSMICGEVTGLLHKLSSEYIPANKKIKRHDWSDNYYIKNFKKFIPSNQKKVHQSYEKIIDEVKKINTNGNFGLIHGDINVGNFCLEDDNLTLFDFDECQYSWYVEDIAIQIFYMVYVVLNDSIEERNQQAKKFLELFMKGYNKHFKITDNEMKLIPLFLKLREIIVYVGIHRSIDFNNLHEFFKMYIKESRERIEGSNPIVNCFETC